MDTTTNREAVPNVPAPESDFSPRKMRVALVVMLGTLFGSSILPFMAYSLLLPQMTQEFGWSATAYSWGYTALMWCGAMVQQPLGRIVDRVGVRPMIIGGTLIVGLLVMAMSRQSGALWQFYLFWGLLGVVGTTAIGYSKVIAALFSNHRGKALAIRRVEPGGARAADQQLAAAELWLARHVLGLAASSSLSSCCLAVSRNLRRQRQRPRRFTIRARCLDDREVVVRTRLLMIAVVSSSHRTVDGSAAAPCAVPGIARLDGSYAAPDDHTHRHHGRRYSSAAGNRLLVHRAHRRAVQRALHARHRHDDQRPGRVLAVWPCLPPAQHSICRRRQTADGHLLSLAFLRPAPFTEVSGIQGMSMAIGMGRGAGRGYCYDRLHLRSGAVVHGREPRTHRAAYLLLPRYYYDKDFTATR
jgi:hypothetical protein